jgi:hypothetical protein
MCSVSSVSGPPISLASSSTSSLFLCQRPTCLHNGQTRQDSRWLEDRSVPLLVRFGTTREPVHMLSAFLFPHWQQTTSHKASPHGKRHNIFSRLSAISRRTGLFPASARLILISLSRWTGSIPGPALLASSSLSTSVSASAPLATSKHKRRIAETPEIDIQHISDLPYGILVRTRRRLEEWIPFQQTRVRQDEISALVAVLDGAAVFDVSSRARWRDIGRVRVWIT